MLVSHLHSRGSNTWAISPTFPGALAGVLGREQQGFKHTLRCGMRALQAAPRLTHWTQQESWGMASISESLFLSPLSLT